MRIDILTTNTVCQVVSTNYKEMKEKEKKIWYSLKMIHSEKLSTSLFQQKNNLANIRESKEKTDVKRKGRRQERKLEKN